MSCLVNWLMSDFGASWVFAKIVIAFPIRHWSDGPGSKSAAAVGANITQNGIDTISTESTLVAADACFQRMGG
jgi:hypothetical protein